MSDDVGEAGPPEVPAAVLHEILLLVAGYVPDDLLAQARTWLADGRHADVVNTLLFAARRYPLPLLPRHYVILGVLLDEDDDVARAPVPEMLWAFGPPPEDRPAESGLAEAGLLAAVARSDGVRGVWRGWRSPVDGAPFPPGVAVHLVLAEPGDLPALTGRLQEAHGGVPCVEVVPVGDELPAYQRLVSAYGELVWASTPAPEIRMARVFDGVDAAGGPVFVADRTRVTGDDLRDELLEYLRAGQPVATTTSTMDDVVDPDRGRVVPMSFRTDGEWIWPDTIAYYLENHGLVVDDDFVAHIRAAGTVPDLDHVDMHRALHSMYGTGGE
jgi:hypothetical protein